MLQFFSMPASPKKDMLLIAGAAYVTMDRPVKGSCHYCGARATTRDHVVPKSRSGRNAWWNLVPSCAPCNTKKGSNTVCSCEWCQRARFLMQNYLEWG